METESFQEMTNLGSIIPTIDLPSPTILQFAEDVCLSCQGTGQSYSNTCAFCDGSGKWCLDCKGIHRVSVKVDGRDLSKVCDCRKEKQIREMLDAKIPALCAPARSGFDGFSAGCRHPKQQIVFDTLSNQPEKGLLLFGSTGVGKSHFGWVAYAEAIRRKQKAYHAVIDSLHDEYNAFSFGNPKGARPNLMVEDLRTNQPAVVFLDEIDKLKNTASGLGFFFKLVDAAAYYKHRIILTSNITNRALEETWNRISIAYGGPLMRRINESCEIFDLRLANCKNCEKQTHVEGGREQCVYCSSPDLKWI